MLFNEMVTIFTVIIIGTKKDISFAEVISRKMLLEGMFKTAMKTHADGICALCTFHSKCSVLNVNIV